MFREKALAKLRSPEQLDEPLKVIYRKNLLASCTLGLLAFVGLAWGIFGHIPETGHGQGILIVPNAIVPIQVQGEGHILQWFVKAGDVVEQGRVIGILEQPLIMQELDQSIDRLAEVQEKNKIVGTLRARYSALERNYFDGNRAVLQSRIKYLEGYISKNKSIAEALHKKNEELLNNELTNLEASRKDTVFLAKAFEERLASHERLWKERLIPEEILKNVRRSYQDATVEIRNLSLRIKEIGLRRVQTEEEYLNMTNLIASRENTLTSLKVQLQELNNREAELKKTDSELQFQQKNEQEDIARNIDKNRKMLTVNREIKSSFPGRILELAVSEGQVVNAGDRVALLDRFDTPEGLYALVYFEAKEGKKLRDGMEVHISPSVVSRNRFGSIVGHISSVSDYPVTTESVINYVGNPAVADALIAGNHRIEAFVRLKKNDRNPSGYEWTSEHGPDVHITDGTLADAWVVVEQRPPVSYILPGIKKWTGL